MGGEVKIHEIYFTETELEYPEGPGQDPGERPQDSTLRRNSSKRQLTASAA